MGTPDYTRIAVEHQLVAMGSPLFELGIFNPDYRDPKSGEIRERMDLRAWSPAVILAPNSLAFLRRQSASGANIYIRPAGEHPLSLIDDLSADTVKVLPSTGFQPAVGVETSPGNFQVWLNHGRVLDRELSTAAARLLAERFRGDLASADWRHFGRLAGFPNRKPKHRMANGLFPFARLRAHAGVPYDAREALILGAACRVAARRAQATARLETWHNRPAPATPAAVKTIDHFRAQVDTRYGGDHTRVDMAYATYAVAVGLAVADIVAALASRDLSHKGTPQRQQAYLQRTIQRALSAPQQARL